jgi:hypothetical protein
MRSIYVFGSFFGFETMNGYAMHGNVKYHPLLVEYSAVTQTSETNHGRPTAPMAVPVATHSRRYLSRWNPRIESVRFLNILATMAHLGNFLGISILYAMNKNDVVFELNWNQLTFAMFQDEDFVNATSYYSMACPTNGVVDSQGFATKCGDSFTYNFQGFLAYMTVQRTGLWLSVTTLVASFFALSFLFEGYWAMNGRAYTYAITTPGAFNFLRYIEYSFSASVMLLLLALQCGVW